MSPSRDLAPRVLAVMPITTGGFGRWLADGFALAGCRVVRMGPERFSPDDPAAERPAYRELPDLAGRAARLAAPGALPRVGDTVAADARADEPVSLSAAERHVRELRFSPDLIVALCAGDDADTAEGLTRDVDASGTIAPVAWLRPASPPAWELAMDHWEAEHVERVLPGVCVMTFRPPDAPAKRAGVLRPADLPSSIGARAEAERAASALWIEQPAHFQAALEAVASGCVIAAPRDARDLGEIAEVAGRILRASPTDEAELEVRRVQAQIEIPARIGRIAQRHTWAHRARQVLRAAHIRPGGLPRL